MMLLNGGWKLLFSGSASSLSSASTATTSTHRAVQQGQQLRQPSRQSNGSRGTATVAWPSGAPDCPTVRSPTTLLQPWLTAQSPTAAVRDEDESGTVAAATVAVLKPEAEIKLSTKCTGSQLSVHVLEARNLRSERGKKCSSFVRVSFYPESRRSGEKCQTAIVPDTDFPLFDRRFALNLPPTEGDDGLAGKNLLVSVWNQLDREGFSEFLGCLTFPLEGLLSCSKPNAWYTLMNEMTRTNQQPLPLPPTQPPPPPHRPSSSSAGNGFDLKSVVIRRPPRSGLGFTVSGSAPCHVSKVERRSPADAAGVRAGDYIVSVDAVGVFHASNETVVRLLRGSGAGGSSEAKVRLELGRPRPVAKSPSLPLNRPPLPPTSLLPSAATSTALSAAAAATLGGGGGGIRRDVKSLYDIASSVPSNSASALPSPSQQPQAQAQPQPQPQVAPTLGPHLHFSHNSRIFCRSLACLSHSGTVSLVESGRLILCQTFLFPDLLLMARPRFSADHEPMILVREPIATHKIACCSVPRGAPCEVCLQFVGRGGRKEMLRLRCSHELESRQWCRSIQQRLLKTLVL